MNGRFDKEPANRPISNGMEILGIALQGLKESLGRVEKAATQIANVAPSGQTPGDSVGLSDAMVALMQARQDFEANLRAIHVGEEMSQKTIDLLA